MQTFSSFSTLNRRSTLLLSENSFSLFPSDSREVSTMLSRAFYLPFHPKPYGKGGRKVLLDDIEKERLAHLDRPEITSSPRNVLGSVDAAASELLLEPLQCAHAVLQPEDVLRRHTTPRHIGHGSLDGCSVSDRERTHDQCGLGGRSPRNACTTGALRLAARTDCGDA